MINRNKFSAILLLNFFIFLVACGETQTQSAENNEIKPQDVQQKIEKNEDMTIIDVRTKGEFVGPLGHIAGAELHPVQKIENWFQKFNDSKNQEIIMVCRSGNRSGVATKFFKDKGFKNVKNMVGGMRAWNKEGLPIEKESPMEAQNDK